MMPLTLDGASARLLRVDGERFVMNATRPAAPGTPLRARIDGTDEHLEMKVGRSIRQPDGTFEIEGRLVNLTRTQRDLVASRLG